jgi:signal peptidase II
MNWKKALGFFAVALFLLGVDLSSKAYVHSHIPTIGASVSAYPFGGIGVFRNWHGIDFSIVHLVNKGAAWGAFSSLQDYLLYVRVAIIGGLLAYLFFVKTSAFRLFSLMLIATGAIGNVIDYFVYSHVVDMFYFIFWGYSYPVFNVADSAIFVGIAFLLGQTLFFKARSSAAPSHKRVSTK